VSHTSKDYQTCWARSDRPGASLIGPGDGFAISPDGSRALVSSSDFQSLFIVPLGAGPTHTVPNPDGLELMSIGNWHPNGRQIVFAANKTGEPARAFLVDVESGKAAPFGPPGAGWAIFTPAPISSDGRFVVLLDADDRPCLWPLDGGAPTPIPGADFEDQILAFTEDDSALFVAGRSVPIVIERLDLATGERTPWLTVSPTDPAGLRYAIATITPDGKQWALSTAKLLTDLFVVEGLK
jgi:hypothetical protein